MDNKKQVIGIIPARLASTRLPKKPLADICGKPLLQWVWEAACRSSILQRVVIATDSTEIINMCLDIGAEYVETESRLPSGTDRIKSAYDKLGESSEIVVNIQGDEPLLNGFIIDTLLDKFLKTNADVGTLIHKIETLDEIMDTSVVKVGIRTDMTATNFSREPIPYFRHIPIEKWLENSNYWKHIGIYAYKIEALNKFVSLPVSNSEKKERLEQLRLLETGANYYCVVIDENLIGVDTPEDLEKVREILSKR